MALCECGCGQETRIGLRSGTANRFIWGHHRRGRGRYLVAQVKSYRRIQSANGRDMLLHRQRAERALGHPLPAGAEVHHADGSKRDNAPLVICQDDAYHKLLHARMRVLAAGGNPNTDAVCGMCRTAKNRAEFRAHRARVFGVADVCLVCVRLQESIRKHFLEFVAAIGRGDLPVTLVKPNLKVINRFAEETQGGQPIDGIKWVTERTIAARG